MKPRDALVCGLALLIILGLHPVNASEQPKTKYYFQPVEGSPLPPTYFMDTPVPEGPPLTCLQEQPKTGCRFITRPLTESHFFHSITITLRLQFDCLNCTNLNASIGRADSNMNPQGGFIDKLYDWQWLPEKRAPITFQTTVDQVVAVGAGQRLAIYFANWTSHWVGRLAPTILFGNGSSYIVTDAVNLEGQPIPELQFPVFALFAVVAATFIIVSAKRPTSSFAKTTNHTQP